MSYEKSEIKIKQGRNDMSHESLFREGSTPFLEEVLLNRERRAGFERKLTGTYPGTSILAFKLNIPGPVKNNEPIRCIFSLGKKDIERVLMNSGFKISYKKELDLKTGPELFLAVLASPVSLKTLMVALEEETPLGRLYDIDILYDDQGEMKSIGRAQTGFPKRKCFVCEEDAKVCGRSRAHTILEMYDRIEEMMKNERRLT